MPRQLPYASPPLLPKLLRRRDPLLDIEIAVVTPMFGGSAIAGQVDPERPVTGQTVRGHLRFWWRACNAPRFASQEELFKSESKIWGSVAGEEGSEPSALDVKIELVSPGKQENLRETNQRGRPVWKQGYPGYALFPFQESNEKPAADPCLTGVAFRLSIVPARHIDPEQVAQLKSDVTDTVRAWLAFGGVGARTRRGCGSLWCATDGFLPANFGDTAEWSRKLALTGSHRPPIPMLSGSHIVIGTRPSAPVTAWNDAVRTMQQFRQGGQGASPWPEAQSIREAAQRRNADGGYFPRADLGMPILFQQMDIEPAPQLTPSNSDRMASPIIVKPFALSEDRAVPLVLLLNAPHVWEMESQRVNLSVGRESYTLNQSQLFDAERSRSVSPLLENNDPRARRAFLRFAATRLRGQEVEI